VDLALSALIEEISKKHFPQSCFYSEENYDAWKFPLLALDPLDGTREFIAGVPEWALSVGHFETESFMGDGWIFNPAKNEIFTMDTVKKAHPKNGILRGEVSRSESTSGLFTDLETSEISLTPCGSIAYKLGRLSHGNSDFVVSLRPKNIWDIAGGSLLCKKAGIEFYSRGKIVTKVEKLYEPPLLWCQPSQFEKLSAHFSS
jgi:myo-inositol-1(or 4)-monophosphatase